MSCVVSASLLFGLAPGASRADTFLYLDSQVGDYIGLGIQRTLRPGTLTATVDGNQVLKLSYANATTSLTMHLEGTDGQPLAVGEYDGASRWPFNPPSNAGLDVSMDGRGCNTISGEFVVREIATAPNGVVTKLAVDFEQYCDSYTAALFGVVRLNSDIGIVDTDGDGVMDIRDDCPQAADPTQSDGDGDGIGDACDAEQGVTAAYFDSLPGDWVGGGVTRAFSVKDVIQATRISGGVEITIAGQGGWSLFFTAPSFGVGTYENAERSAFRSPNSPGLDVYGNGRGCNTIAGRYVVREAVFEDDGSVRNLAIDFEQYCEGYMPPLIGAVRFNALHTPLPQLDSDGDHHLDFADNCPGVANPDQSDRDGDELGDACDPYPDQADNLGQCLTDRDASSFPQVQQLQAQLAAANAQIAVVTADSDGDGVLDLADHCAGTAEGASVDQDGCTPAQACAAVEITAKASKKLCLLIHSDAGVKLCKVAKGPNKTKLCRPR